MEAVRCLLGNIHLSFHPFTQVVFDEHVLVVSVGLGSELCETWSVPSQSLQCAGGNQTALPGNLGSSTRQALGQPALYFIGSKGNGWNPSSCSLTRHTGEGKR